jgi:hypothetical protein
VILLPYIIYEHDLTRANDFEIAFILTRKFTVDRILISKIFEYSKLCSKFFKRHQDTDPFLSKLAEMFEPIAAKVKDAKWAAILRNTISFHYDPEYALTSLDRLDYNHPLSLMAGRIKGLTLFEFAEEITSRPIFEAAGSGDIGRGMDIANTFIVELVNSITTFHASATKSMFKNHGMVSERTTMKLHSKYCAAPEDMHIPISISSSYLRALKSKGLRNKRRSKRRRRKTA